MKNLLPEIQTEHFYSIVRFNNRELKLIYKIEEYKKVNEQKKDNLRSRGYKTKIYKRRKDDGEVVVQHYIPYATKIVPIDNRTEIVDRILNSTVSDKNSKENIKLVDKIEDKWYNINVHKTTKTNLEDEESRLLERLADYYMGGLEGSGILTRDLSRAIHRSEIVTTSGMVNTDIDGNVLEHKNNRDTNNNKRWELRQLSKEDWNKTMEELPKTWRNSRTHKHSKIYSHFPLKSEEGYYWGTNRKMKSSDRFNIHRLINPKEEYTSVWCLVNTKNIFELDNNRFKISNDVLGYQPDPLDEERYEMDKILVVSQNGSTYYFDQNIDMIPNEFIQQIN